MTPDPRDRLARFVRWLVGQRVPVLLVASVMALAAGWRTVQTYRALRSDLEELLPESAPSVLALDSLRARLPGLRHLGVVIDTGGPGNVEAANRFVDALAERIRAYPKDMVSGVRADITAERRFAETYALQLVEPDDVKKLRVAVEARRDWHATRAMGADLLDEEEDPPPELPIAEVRAKYERRFGKPRRFPGDRFVSEDGRTVVLLVRAASSATDYASDHRLLSRVRADIDALGFPAAYAEGMRVGFAGDVPTRVEEMDGLVADLSISGALVLLLVCGSIMWFFRSFRSLLILGVPLLYGTVYTFGLSALPPFSIRHLNSNTAFLGSIVIGNGINSGIILLARFQEQRAAGDPLVDAMIAAVRTTWRPTLAAASAASAAYGSLIFTDFRGFNQFGWIGAIGMLTCWATTMIVAPPVISVIGERIGASGRGGPRIGPRLADLVLARPRAVLAVTAVATIAGLAGMATRTGDWLEHDFSKLRRRDSWVSGERYWGKRMDDTLRAYLTPTVVMAADPKSAKIIERRIRAMQGTDRAGGLVANVRSASTLLPAYRSRSIEEARILKRTLTPRLEQDLEPRDRKLVERALSDEALRSLAARDLPDVFLAGLREYDGRIDRNVLVYPKLGGGTWDVRRMRDFTRDVRSAATVDGRAAAVAGSLLLSSDIVAATKADGPRATAIALATVLVIAFAAFRSVGLSFSAVASLLVGVAVMLGGIAWTGAKLNFSNFVALPITFGIGADYAINVLKRYQSDEGADLLGAVGRTGGAVAMCSLTTIIGFGSLLVAQNQALFSFGVFAVAGELACLATAILALPAVLWLARSRLAPSPA